MGFIERNLMPEEKVVYEAKLHWFVFAWPVALVTLAIAGISAKTGSALSFLVAPAILLAIGTGIHSAITFATSEFGVTNKRVLIKVGYISRSSVETLLKKVEGIQVNQSIPGRMFNFGTIVVVGTGGTKQPFHKIAAPLQFRRAVQEEIEGTR